MCEARERRTGPQEEAAEEQELVWMPCEMTDEPPLLAKGEKVRGVVGRGCRTPGTEPVSSELTFWVQASAGNRQSQTFRGMGNCRKFQIKPLNYERHRCAGVNRGLVFITSLLLQHWRHHTPCDLLHHHDEHLIFSKSDLSHFHLSSQIGCRPHMWPYNCIQNSLIKMCGHPFSQAIHHHLVSATSQPKVGRCNCAA